jgi:hypothetical protein
MKKIVTISFLLISLLGLSQVNSVAYTRDYEFSEGLYLTIDQFKNNTPIDKSSIVANVSKNSVDFLKQVVQKKHIVYRDTMGIEQKHQTSEIWGYNQNRMLYINYNNDFSRVNVIGTLLQFTALIKASASFMDPMYSNYGLSTTTEELRQFIYDTQTGRTVPFDLKSFTNLLKSDTELYDQFMKLGKREKYDSQFIYLRKYNEKHPLMLPSR